MEQNFSLRHLNTFGLDVTAKEYQLVKSTEDLQEALTHSQAKEALILGGGSNVLFTNNVDRLVIHMALKGLDVLDENEDYVWIKVGAGETWHDFVLKCIESGFNGVENLSLIPGSVGAAPMQNIGAYGVEQKSVFHSLEGVSRMDGSIHIFTKGDCKFGYRESIFKNDARGQYLITSVTYKLSKRPELNISYGAIKETLEATGIKNITAREVSNAVISIRQSKLPDPRVIGNAGSFFKNPTVDKIDYEALKIEFGGIPGYLLPEDKVKIPAAYMIEQCGWKGHTRGAVGVHKDQPLVLVNYGGVKGQDIVDLAKEIQESVANKFGIELMAEVNIID